MKKLYAVKNNGRGYNPRPHPFQSDYFVSLLYLLLKRSTRPVVSTSFCVPVKNGWHAEQISTWRFFAVDFVLITLPHEHVISCSVYSGWIFFFILLLRFYEYTVCFHRQEISSSPQRRWCIHRVEELLIIVCLLHLVNERYGHIDIVKITESGTEQEHTRKHISRKKKIITSCS